MIELSIIIPVYNAQTYLEECIESLVSEDMRSYEIILIDDGSTDNSGTICDSYAEKYSNIRVFHIQNQGVSNARNVGIQNAKGKWIMFVDADDKIICDVNTLFESLSDDCDGVYFNYSRHEKIINTINKKSKVLNAIDMLLTTLDRMKYFDRISTALTLKPSVMDSCWAKIYQKNIIRKNNILFDTQLRLSEDTLFNIRYLMCADKILCIDSEIYYYRDNGESVCNNFKFENIENRRLLTEKIGTIDFKEDYKQASNMYCVCILLQLQQQLENQGNNAYAQEFFKLLKTEAIQKIIKASRRYNLSMGRFRNIRNIIILNLWKMKLYKLSYNVDKCIEKIRRCCIK